MNGHPRQVTSRRSFQLLPQSPQTEAAGIAEGQPPIDTITRDAEEPSSHLRTLLTLCQRLVGASSVDLAIKGEHGWITLGQPANAKSRPASRASDAAASPATSAGPQRRHVVTLPSVPWLMMTLLVPRPVPAESAVLLTQALALAVPLLRIGEYLHREQRLRRRVIELQAELAHELRTPLTAISGFAQLLQRPGQLDEQRRRSYAGIAVTETRQASAIIDHFVAGLQAEAEALATSTTPGDEVRGPARA